MSTSVEFQFVEPRATVEVQLEDGRVIAGPRGSKVGEFLKLLDSSPDKPVVGVIVNGDLRELTYAIKMDLKVRLVTMEDEDGMRIYRRSLTFLLVMAFEALFPGVSLTIDHSVAAGGYFCQVTHGKPLSVDQLEILEKRMQEIVQADMPVFREQVPLQDAITNFTERGYLDKARLLAHRKKDYLMQYRIGDHCDYHHGYMVPSTGYLKWFVLALTEGGFTLRFPRRRNPTGLTPLPAYPRMLATFREYGDWLEYLGIASAGALNDAIHEGRVPEIVLVSDALHQQRISEIANLIASQKDRIRVILIAGPSSSGKTTFSKRLTI